MVSLETSPEKYKIYYLPYGISEWKHKHGGIRRSFYAEKFFEK